jgi:hypothetical protein
MDLGQIHEDACTRELVRLQQDATKAGLVRVRLGSLVQKRTYNEIWDGMGCPAITILG